MTLIARDGTPFIFASAHIKDGNNVDKALNIRTQIPKPKDKFKKSAIRNILLQLADMPTPAVSQGSKTRTPIVVLGGDFNSLRHVVEEAVETTTFPPESKHDPVSYVGLDPRHLQRLHGEKRERDWIISTSYMEALVEEEPPIVAHDGAHIALFAHITSRRRPPRQANLPGIAGLRISQQTVKNHILDKKADMLRRQNWEKAIQDQVDAEARRKEVSHQLALQKQEDQEMSQSDSDEEATQSMPGKMMQLDDDNDADLSQEPQQKKKAKA